MDEFMYRKKNDVFYVNQLIEDYSSALNKNSLASRALFFLPQAKLPKSSSRNGAKGKLYFRDNERTMREVRRHKQYHSSASVPNLENGTLITQTTDVKIIGQQQEMAAMSDTGKNGVSKAFILLWQYVVAMGPENCHKFLNRQILVQLQFQTRACALDLIFPRRTNLKQRTLTQSTKLPSSSHF